VWVCGVKHTHTHYTQTQHDTNTILFGNPQPLKHKAGAQAWAGSSSNVHWLPPPLPPTARCVATRTGGPPATGVWTAPQPGLQLHHVTPAGDCVLLAPKGLSIHVTALPTPSAATTQRKDQVKDRATLNVVLARLVQNKRRGCG